MTPSVLIVDDQQSLREMLEILLSREGYQVATAGSGPEALELFQKTPFSVVLTDIRMRPMDGLSLLKEIKSPSAPNGSHHDFGLCQSGNGHGGHE